MRIACVSSVFLSIFVLCSCWPPSKEREGVAADVAAIVKNLLVPEEVFLSIPDGASFDTVTNMLGGSVRHGFTIAETNGVYTQIGCLVAVGDGVYFSLLFRDKTLVKTFQPPRREMEEVPYRGTTLRRAKSWDIEDNAYIAKTIHAPAMTRAKIKAYLDWLRPDKRTAGEPGNIMPAFLLTSYFEKTWARTKKYYETNQELRKRYDGCRAHLGMTVGETDALYGIPLRVFATKQGLPVRVYGDTRYLDINPQYRFSCLAIVFDGQGRAMQIYGYGYFNEEWLK